MSINAFDHETLQAICDVLGHTRGGLTGSEIGRLLGESGIADSDISTKRHRLFDALSRRQAIDRSGNDVGTFLQRVLFPVRWVGRSHEWMRADLESVLAFSGLATDDAGKLEPSAARTTLVEPPLNAPEPESPSLEVLAHQGRRQDLAELQSEFTQLVTELDRQGADS